MQALFFSIILSNTLAIGMSWFPNLVSKTGSSGPIRSILKTSAPSWDALDEISQMNPTSAKLIEDLRLRERGDGSPHTDAKIRLFGTSGEPRITYYRDTAAW